MKGLSDYYPMAPATGGTPKMREVLSSINRAEDEEFDLIYAHKIKITAEEIKEEDYTAFIMNVINKAIEGHE